MPLFTLDKPTYEATAGTVIAIDIQKPMGREIHIRRIGVTTERIVACNFPLVVGYLRPKDKTIGGVIPLFNKRPSNTQRSAYPCPLFVGDVDWPQGWELRVMFRTQNAAETVHVCIQYEIILKPEEARRGWGQA